MAKPAEAASVADLERALDAKKSRLAKLHRKRDQIERRWETVVEKINRIEGAKRRAESFANRDRRRAQNERPLREVVTDILCQNKKGLGPGPARTLRYLGSLGWLAPCGLMW